MARRKRGKISEPFFPVPDDLPASAAWRLLSHGERSVYIAMRREWSRQARNDYSKQFLAPYEDLQAAAATVAGAIRNLQRLGFIAIEEDARGGLFGGPTRYLMSQEWRVYQPTPEEAERLKAKAGRMAKSRTISRARRLQRLRDFERGENQTQLQSVKNAASVSEGTAQAGRGLIASVSEAGKEGRNGRKP